jgi:hypothetical protein
LCLNIKSNSEFASELDKAYDLLGQSIEQSAASPPSRDYCFELRARASPARALRFGVAKLHIQIIVEEGCPGGAGLGVKRVRRKYLRQSACSQYCTLGFAIVI